MNSRDARAPRPKTPAPRAPRSDRAGPLPPANPIPALTFDEALPVSSRRAEIAAAIQDHQVVIVCGETGSGKTTQLPKICLELGRGLGAGGTGLIGHTQPRRLAATSTAKRIAQELGTPLGEHVGYKIRFGDQLSAGASVKLMTDGILLAETQSDPLLRAYDTLILDEAHERSLNIDFLLGYLKQLLPKRPDLKLIITSATLDAERFARHFGAGEGEDLVPAPVVEVSGRLYPVEIRWRPLEPTQPGAPKAGAANDKKPASPQDGRDLCDAIVDAVDELAREGPGDVLVFLPGEREIREAAIALRRHHPPHTEILPLYARLSVANQEKIFRPSNARRIVLATNVAETSLTVPGIRYVVDTGLARVKRYSYRNKVEQLQVEPVAQSAANQRAGRCGRVADGVCIRLYDETDFARRPRFTDPEILRSSLAAVILRMKALRLADVDAFPFVDPPSGRAVADGYHLLQELGAVDDALQLTPVGRELAKLPLDPRLARMLLAARDQHCLDEMLIIASALSVQDPRERPPDAQGAADAAHRAWADERSEFVGWVKLWRWMTDAYAQKTSQRQFNELCKSKFLHPLRLREWRDVHAQLQAAVADKGWRLNATDATYEQLHCALLTGLLGNLGCKSETETWYLGARSVKFHLWPGSALAKKAGRWVVAAELVETSRVFARTIAKIEPQWVERVAGHLLKKSLSDPLWSKKSAQVVADERGTLYGLPIYQQRRVDFGRRDPVVAREIFIRRALVDGDFETKLPFFAHNRKLVAEIEKLEHKSRRQDVLVDDELIYAFYDQQLPADVVSGATLERWYTQAVAQAKAAGQSTKLLYLNRDDLMRHEAAGVTSDQFPKALSVAGIVMTLDYHFEPGSPRDGVTLVVPLFALNQVDPKQTDWLVPGMRRDKVQQLLKSLPQKLRRHCVPLPDYAQQFCDRHPDGAASAHGADLIDALIADIRGQTQIVVKRTDFKLETLPPHQSCNYRVVDEHGRQLAIGRNLAQLRAELGQQAQRQFQQAFQKALGGAQPMVHAMMPEASVAQRAAPAAAAAAIAPATAPLAGNPDDYCGLKSWTFDALPELLELPGRGKQKGTTLFGYPALVDYGTHCDVEVFDDPDEARRIHRAGLRRLFALQLAEPLKFLAKNIPNLAQMAMQFMPLGTQDELRDQILDATLERACLTEPLPQNAQQFAARRDDARARLTLLAQEIARLVGGILADYATVLKKLPQLKAHAVVAADVDAQLQRLLTKQFIRGTPYPQLAHFPRYLKAIALRIDKLKADATRDAQRSAELAPLVQQWQRARSQLRGGHDPRLDEFRWLLEELRVSLFAQELRTPMPVSVKRLQKVWESWQR